jgi:hypothetical protein
MLHCIKTHCGVLGIFRLMTKDRSSMQLYASQLLKTLKNNYEEIQNIKITPCILNA